ncbi:carbohydrate ABC transporter permease [Lachnotalea sp. AF33-28]|jgi:putative aldouronate transport system permease protein|uniref:carbohydrate ABC transporter permease n=1 Tax=Lachnotalea sp. AF33-28 TaxID=2292046 RepID=UPI000E47BC35|nr:carbohydrate ABC transporter permease [Lachnotalea sp. AF33-28]RHP36294.1 carbohydrate ABC transporter permease [Lachnotalea sp. AF33-28]
MKIKTGLSRKIFLCINYTFLGVTALLCLLPFVHLLALSFSGSVPVAAGSVGLWPRDFTFASYQFALKSPYFFRTMGNSFVRVVLGAGLNLLLMLLMAYPLSKPREKLLGRNIYMGICVFTMIFSGGLIPNYMVINQLGLMDTIWALVLPGALPVYNMVILMNFFRGLPPELEDAALIDGANEWCVLWRIIVPVSKPGIATVLLFCIVGHWNSWFDGIIYMNKMIHYPLQSYLQKMIMDMETMMRASGGDYVLLLSMMNARTGRAAQLFLGALPMLIVYPFLQKYFTKGLVLGSVKG